MATTKSPHNPFGITMTGVPANTKVRLELNCDAIMEPSSAEITTKTDNQKIAMVAKVNWKFEKLARKRQQIPANVVYKLMVDGRDVGEKIETVTIHSINDCPIYGRDNETKPFQSISFFLAAYINEDHPLIDKLLKESLDTKIVNEFDGYQKKDPAQVVRQVLAIWHALHLKGIKYSNITTTPDKSDKIFSQHVRLLDEALDNGQANCADGSVLFASVLQKLGIDSGVVFVPGHMFVVFYTEPGRKNPVCLETTMLGNADPKYDFSHDLLTTKKAKIAKSEKQFNDAIAVGAAEIQKAAEEEKKFKNDVAARFHSGASANVDTPLLPPIYIVHVADFRKAGFTPIPYYPPQK